MTDPTPDVPTLRRLLAEATPGPWEDVRVPFRETASYSIKVDDKVLALVGWEKEEPVRAPADAALIVAAVNALPGILDERDRMLATDFEAVIDEHFVMWHEMGGNDEPPGEWRCQCGLKFGFSHTAVQHVATALRAALAEVTP